MPAYFPTLLWYDNICQSASLIAWALQENSNLFKELNAMLPQTPEQLEAVRQDCRRLLHKRAALSAAAAIIPLPGADISADIAIMAELLTTINARFGLTPEQVAHLDLERKRILIVLITSAGNEFIGKTITARMVRTTLRLSLIHI